MSKPFDSFLREVRRGERFRVHCESLISQSQIRPSHVEYVYEVTFLSVFVAFEQYLEDLFVAMMCGAHLPRKCQFGRRVVFSSAEVARMNLYGGQRYVDLLPFDRTVRKAEIFFRGGRPFSSLGNAEKSDLTFLHLIRNCVAHKSRASLGSFEHELTKRHSLPPSQHTPARYLRSGFSAGQTRFQIELGTLIFIASELDSP